MRIPLALNPGVVSDETPFSTPGSYAAVQNMRFRYGRPETIGAWEEFVDDVLSGVCRSALAWTDNLGVLNVAFGTNTHLYVIKAGVLYDITPAGLASGAVDSIFFDGGYGSGGYGMGGYGVGQNADIARTWSLACYGESLMACPAGGTIYWWQNDPMVPAAALTGAPASVNRMTVAYNRQVIAEACTQEDGIFNPMCIRNSDTEDPTDWITSANDNVSEEILPGGGTIVDGRPFGDDQIVWTDDALFVGTFVGQAEQAWRYDRIAVNCGLASPQAAVVVNQTAYWLTPDLQFFGYQYGGAPTPIPCPIRREFTENLVSEQIAKVIAVSVGEFGEIWFLYPDVRDGIENSRHLILNTSDNSWSLGNVARTAMIDGGPITYPLAVDYAGQTYLHEKGDAAVDWFIETSLQYIGEGENHVMLRSIWPDFEAQAGDIDLSIKTRAYPQSVERTKGPYVLAPGREKKDFMVEGRLVAIRLSGDAFMRLGKPSFDAVVTGGR